MTWRFLTRQAVEAFHAEQLRRHGGAAGIRDENALGSAMARAENKAAYGDPDIHELAAAYLFGLARNHAFVDGNKRAAIVSAGAFLILNGYELAADQGTVYEFVMGAASGEIDEAGATAFFRDFVRPNDPPSP